MKTTKKAQVRKRRTPAPSPAERARHELAEQLLTGPVTPVSLLHLVMAEAERGAEMAMRGAELAQQQATLWEAVRAKAAEGVRALEQHYWRVRADRATRKK